MERGDPDACLLERCRSSQAASSAPSAAPSAASAAPKLRRRSRSVSIVPSMSPSQAPSASSSLAASCAPSAVPSAAFPPPQCWSNLRRRGKQAAELLQLGFHVGVCGRSGRWRSWSGRWRHSSPRRHASSGVRTTARDTIEQRGVRGGEGCSARPHPRNLGSTPACPTRTQHRHRPATTTTQAGKAAAAELRL